MNAQHLRSVARIVVAFAVTLLAACGEKAATPLADTAVGGGANTPKNVTLTVDQKQRIQLVTIESVSFRPIVEATGNVAFNGDRSTQVLSTVSGPATKVVVNPGTVVSRGQPLAYVSSPDFASAVADYRKAQTGFRNAKRIVDRDSALFANDALARGDLEQAQADLAGAEADLEAAVQNMRALGVEESQINAIQQGKSAPIQAIIRAPIAGTVVEKLIADGQLLAAGSTPAFTIADLSTMWIMANVFANDLNDVAVGQPVDIITDIAQKPISGKVDYIAALADPGTKAVTVRIVAPNVNHMLRRDMFVRVQIKSSHEHRGILVPVASVLRDDQNLPYVFISTPTGYARRRVDLGSRVGDKYEITSGLKAGDQVVADGALFLQFAETQ
jgi:cobalt-zinc-cadmium efflux system membrane fusion protein